MASASLSRAVCAFSLGVLVACSGGGINDITGPGDVPAPAATPVAPLPVPAQLRGVWATQDQALARASRYQANVVILQIDAWGEDLTPTAQAMRERGIGAMAYVEQVFNAPRAQWDPGWTRVETWARPLREAGILWGFHVMDEPALRGRTGYRDAANAYVRSRGYDVLGTEWIDYVSDKGAYRLPRPTGVRWYAVTCYDFGGGGLGRPKWHIQNCAEEYARHRDWDSVIAQGFDAGNGMPSSARWEAIAQGRSIFWWIDQ